MTAAPDAPATPPSAGSPFERVLRGSAFVALGYGGSQALRLAANLVLTRLLFPEAFGIMALVSVVLVGLAMVSDLGIGPSIMQHARGDDPAFLDTAWSIQIARGGILWLATLALAWPAAAFYDAPELRALLPAAGLTLLIAGFNPTRIETAGRHLMLGRVTLLDLASQVLGTASIIGLAWAMESVWALVLGAIVGALARLALMHRFLPGPVNRPRWNPEAARDILHFGKWIFLGTICGFVMGQQDKAILGRYLSLEGLGVYNIGYFLASFAVMLGGTVAGRVTIPLYRALAAAPTEATARRLRWLRAGLTGGVLAALAAAGVFGPALVGLLYDPRYAAAGAVVSALACAHIPHAIGMSYDQAALAAGDSRRFFALLAVRAVAQTALFLIGVEVAGLAGALVGHASAHALTHPLLIGLARRYRVWDPVHDLGYALAGAAIAAGVIALHGPELAALARFG